MACPKTGAPASSVNRPRAAAGDAKDLAQPDNAMVPAADAENLATSGNLKGAAADAQELPPSGNAREAAADAEVLALNFDLEPQKKKQKQAAGDLHPAVDTEPWTPKKPTWVAPAAADSEPAVPVAALRTARSQGPPAASRGEAPQMPAVDSGQNADVTRNMRDIVPYVLYHLRETIKVADELRFQFADVDPHLHEPLEITTAGNADRLSSYKPPWALADAQTSLATTGLYEVAGNLLRCHPHAPTGGPNAVIAGDPLVWSDVVEAAEFFFTMDACKTHASTPANVGRLTFPTSI